MNWREWKKATVQFNYHISVDGMLYSVPYEFIKRKVDVRVTDTIIEIFYNHNRIASHRRLYGRKGQYSTVTEHMPADHQKYLEWNGDRFRKWAERIGTNTCKAVHAILASQRVEQQSYRSCMGLLKLADKYSAERLEAACRKALSYTASPSYKSIKNILAAGQGQDGIGAAGSPTLHQLRTSTPSLVVLTTTGGKNHDQSKHNRQTIEMRLTSMSDAFITQMDDPKMKDVPFEDRFGLLVDIEYNNRKSNSLKRLIKGAGFDQPAYIADINYTSGRKLNRA